LLLCGGGVLVDEPRHRVAAERSAAAGREKWFVGFAVAFPQPSLQHHDGLAGEGRAAVFPSLAQAPDMGAVPEVNVAATQSRQLRDPQPGLDGHEEQRVVTTADPPRCVWGGE
jgi:hypothetical protein